MLLRTLSGPGLIPAHAGKTCRSLTIRLPSGAHPRSRGENPDLLRGHRSVSGSSPLTRGKRRVTRRRPHPRWLIPAHAGKTGVGDVGNGGHWAHPRSRGENQLGKRRVEGVKGSSPLTRGKLEVPTGPGGGDGLIPAHAGKTHSSFGRNEGRPAHPRSRGENVKVSVVAETKSGSSPLTRGKRLLATSVDSMRGLIPAHAGKTGPVWPLGPGKWAHPRSRGENPPRLSVDAPHEGSSPLTRGKRSRAWSPTPTPGLIPAHAGKTRVAIYNVTTTGAHPRSRGENSETLAMVRPGSGSSPLTRGKHVDCLNIPGAPRLIPAHAGKTPSRSAHRRFGRAHPRSRGENCPKPRPAASGTGSSPLTRGKRLRRAGG